MSEAAAGYSFFRSICDRCHVDTSDLRTILLEMEYDTSAAMLEMSRRVKEEQLEDSRQMQCHFTLISSDYDLFRVQEVQRLSASRSFLRPLVVNRSTWDFVYAFYPYCVSHDGITAFLGRVTVLSADLTIVLTNLEAVIAENSFFAKENWDRLNSTIAKFRHYCEMLHHPRAEFREDMRIQTEVLEKCLFDLREVILGRRRRLSTEDVPVHLAVSRSRFVISHRWPSMRGREWRLCTFLGDLTRCYFFTVDSEASDAIDGLESTCEPCVLGGSACAVVGIDT